LAGEPPEEQGRLRQWPTIDLLRAYAVAHPDLFAAAVLVGSFAAGRADPLSDVDLVLLVPDGGFERTWSHRSPVSESEFTTHPNPMDHAYSIFKGAIRGLATDLSSPNVRSSNADNGEVAERTERMNS
jgi:Nucleotidyltransferase domain